MPYNCCCCCWVTSVMSDSARPHRRQPTRLSAPGILQARTLEWVAISFSNAGKWKVKVKSLSRVWLFTTPWTAALQAPPSFHGILQARGLEWGAITFSDVTVRMAKNPKHWELQILAKMQNRNSHSLVVGMQVVQSVWKKIVGFLQIKHAPIIWSSNFVPWYLSKWIENVCPYKSLNRCYRSFIYNCQNLEATKMSFSRWKDK